MASMNTIRTTTIRFQTEGEQQTRSAIDGLADAEDRRARAATNTANVVETSAKRQLSANQALDRLNKQIDADYRAQQSLHRASGTIDRAANQGLIDQAERARLMDLASTRYAPKSPAGTNDNDSSRRGLSSYDKSFIKYQGFDVASSLSSGANPLTVLTQQGVQVAQQLGDREGGLGAGLKALGVSALSIVTPFTVAATAVAAIGGAFVLAGVQAGRQSDALEKATRGVGAATGATAAQLDTLAKANAEAGKVSVGTAREIAAGYASTGQVVLPVIGDLIARTSEYARITGQEIPAATSELARLFADPARGAEELATKLGGLDDRTREFIRTQTENGDRTAAQTALAEVLKASIDANAAATTGWAAAWNTAAAAAGSYWSAAMKIAGIKLGTAPEGAADATARLTAEVDKANKIRSAIGAQPLSLGDSRVVQRDTAALVADTERRQAEARAAEEKANQASRAAGDISRSYEPQAARLSELRSQQSTLRDALADPLTRSKVNIDETESAYRAATRAVDSLTDGTGKLIDRQEMARRGDQLRLDALKATTDAEKAAVAERQKAFDLIGKTITGGDAREQIARAGQLSLASASEKAGGGGSKAEARDDYDRALRSAEDRTRRMAEDATTYGMGAEAVARYRTETELLTAAKRAERDITPELTAQIADYANRAAEAAAKQESLREAMKTMDSIRGTGREVFSGLFQDISKGASAADTLTHALSRVQSRILDMAANTLTDSLFGRQGSSGGILGSLLGASGGSGSLNNIGNAVSTGGFNPFPGFADGGFLGGPGGPRSDSLLIRASPGEYVVNAQATSMYRPLLEHINGGLGNLMGFADGGFVPRMPGGEFGKSAGFGKVLT